MWTKLCVNGTEHALEHDPRTTILDALRNHLGLTGSKKGCDHGQCGACTVLINGRRINSCLTLACMHDGGCGDHQRDIQRLRRAGARVSRDPRQDLPAPPHLIARMGRCAETEKNDDRLPG